MAGEDAPPSAALAVPWRFENPYADAAHPGFCCATGHFIAIPDESADAEAGARRLGADGEVAPETTAAKVWPGSYILSRHLDQTHVAASVAGGRVLELGAGLGVPGLVTAVAGASEVLLTDLEENLPRLRAAVARNAAVTTACPQVNVESLDWTVAPLPESLTAKPWDVILAADCVYVRQLSPRRYRYLTCTARARKLQRTPQEPDRFFVVPLQRRSGLGYSCRC